MHKLKQMIQKSGLAASGQETDQVYSTDPEASMGNTERRICLIAYHKSRLIYV